MNNRIYRAAAIFIAVLMLLSGIPLPVSAGDFGMSGEGDSLSTTDSVSEEALINALKDSNESLVVTEVVKTGSAAAFGTFSNGGDILGFDGGIILATGNVSDITKSYSDLADTSLGTEGDDDLAAIAEKTIFDAAILSFKIIPTGDQVKFRYRFASEEYPEYTEGDYNDSFAFIINGTNYALLPDGTTTVGINNVNMSNNAEYYVGNTGDTVTGHGGNGIAGQIDFVYGGATTILEFTAPVDQGVENTVKLVIGDGGDAQYDSAVFIEGGSMRSTMSTNHKPTDINLSSSSVADNSPAGTEIGTFTPVDEDAGDTHTFILAVGSGATDNASFNISGNKLILNEEADYSAKSSYSIRVRVSDQYGDFYEKIFTINVTEKLDQAAPAVPAASSITANSAVLTSDTGSMITFNGETKASGSTWTGLTPGTTYSDAYACMPADVTHNQSPNSGTVSFTTLKLNQAAPAVPAASSITANSVVLTSDTGSMITFNGETKASGSAWTGLTPGTTYSDAYAYMPADVTHNQSPNSGTASFTTLKLNQAAPAVPAASSITANSAVLTSDTGSMITFNGETKASGSTWTGLAPGTTYSDAYAYMPSDVTHNQSPNSGTASFTTLKLDQAAPAVPIASSITANSVVLTSDTGSMITFNGETKASGSSWTGLTPGTTYSDAYAYMPADITHNQSPNSGTVSFTTLKLNQAAPAVPAASSITANSAVLTSDTGSMITFNGETKASGSTWTGLTPGTTYSDAYAYMPADITHNQSPNSGTVSFTTLNVSSRDRDNDDGDDSSPSNPPGTTSGNTTPTSGAATGVDVFVNGQRENAGIATNTNDGDKKVTTVAVDAEKLEQKLEAEGINTVITIPINMEADIMVGELNGQMVKNMESKQAVLEVKTEAASYRLPAQQIDIDTVSEQIGKNIELKDIKVQVEISKPTDDMVKIVEDSAKTGEFTIVVPPMEFRVRCTYESKTVEVRSFNAFVERMVAVPDGIDPNKITTGVVVEPDGAVRHVPTKITIVDGRYYAVINSLSNSTYSVVWHPLEFRDAVGHWAKEAINDMGSRMVISGMDDDMFGPDRDITRAEFAAIIVRGLGLKPGVGANVFSDVNSSDWYCDYIKTAADYKIITGYGNGKFGPNDKITREQAMAIAARAMSITGLKVGLTAADAEKLLAGFTDGNKSAAYAKDSIAACIKSGVIAGRGGNLIAPKANITRAEVAAIIRRLLQKSDLI